MPECKELYHFEYEDCEFIVGPADMVSELDIPGITPSLYNVNNNFKLEKVKNVLCGELQNNNKGEIGAVSEMEIHKQYFGTAEYEIEIEKKCKLMLVGLADIISIYKDDICQNVFYSAGETKLMDVNKGIYKIETESWGHCNFEDIRLSSLIMGSHKGVNKIVKINTAEDLTHRWSFSLGEYMVEDDLCKGIDYELMMNIDAYNKPVSPLNAIYKKRIFIPRDSNENILYFSIADCTIEVYVNGTSAGYVCCQNPYLCITNLVVNGEYAEICLKISRKYYANRVGNIMLYSGNKIERCIYRNTTFEGETPTMLSDTSLPLSIQYGEKKVILPEICEIGKHNIKLIFKGKNMILTVSCNNHIVGRVVLDNTKFPKVVGGKYNEVYICKEWLLKNTPVIKCQAIAKDAVLDSIDLKILMNLP